MHLTAGIASAMTSLILVGVIRRLAEKWQLLDIPNERSSHQRPTPSGGGLAIVGITVGGVGLTWGLNWDIFIEETFYIVIGATIVAVVSCIDDIRHVSSGIRLAAHCFAAILVIHGLGHWKLLGLPFGREISLAWLGWPLTLLWLLWLTNAYNFMDGIDGIAGTQAIVAATGWALWGYHYSQPGIVFLSFLLAGSSLGFLWHNWHPAKIFMGDVGSAFLGFTFASMPLLGREKDSTAILYGMLVLWPFVLDSSVTLLCRLLRGENIFTAHRLHYYQSLASRYSHSSVALLYGGLAAAGVFAGCVLIR